MARPKQTSGGILPRLAMPQIATDRGGKCVHPRIRGNEPEDGARSTEGSATGPSPGRDQRAMFPAPAGMNLKVERAPPEGWNRSGSRIRPDHTVSRIRGNEPEDGARSTGGSGTGPSPGRDQCAMFPAPAGMNLTVERAPPEGWNRSGSRARPDHTVSRIRGNEPEDGARSTEGGGTGPSPGRDQCALFPASAGMNLTVERAPPEGWNRSESRIRPDHNVPRTRGDCPRSASF